MKFPIHLQNANIPASGKGFALVATLMLMILLVIISVGILSLSTVTLRNSSQNSAQLQAQANARMALMIAIGELQKYAGPDRAITATSEILSTSPVSKPNTTGVWESWWDFDPSTAPNYSTEKTKRFRRWLVSGDEAGASSMNFVTNPWSGDTIKLVGDGTLGTSATDDQKVIAGLVPVVVDDKLQGGYAWHIADESVKARVNLYRDPSQNTTLAQKRALLSGHRPDPSVLKSADGNALTCFPNDLTPAAYVNAKATTGKVLDLDQAELLDLAEGKIKPLRHHITPYSLGVMSDVRSGGLKQDLSSVFEMGSASANTLPTEFSGKRLYASTHGITDASATSSDPKWSALAGYYNSFRSLTTSDTNPTVAVKQSAASINPVPDGYNPAPVIAKVDTIFSLVGRPLTDVFWLASNTKYDYFVSLIYTPVVTLHNPYNCSISFQSMQVTFTNIPVAFNFYLVPSGIGSGTSQSVIANTFESPNTMFLAQSNGGWRPRGNKSYVMTIANWANTQPLATSAAISSPIVMKPGQTLICGPSYSPTASFRTDGGLGSNTVGFDWESKHTSSIKAKPQFIPGLGFETTGTAISHVRPAPWANMGSWCNYLMLRSAAHPPGSLSTAAVTDKFYVKYKVQRPSWFTDDATVTPTLAAPTFSVTAKLQATASDTLVDCAKLQFDYQDDATIGSVFNNRVYQYPPTAPAGAYTGAQIAAPGGTAYSAQGSYVHPICIFSAYMRTANGGVYETGSRKPKALSNSQNNLLKDGRLAGKPFLFHNASRTNFVTDLATEKPAAQSYELNFQPFLSPSDFQGYMDVDAANRVPSLAGNKTTSGIKSGSYIEIPSGPLQTIADFRRSNALATAYAPYFVQPVANSQLHPLMSANKVVESNPSIVANTMLDHSVLANHALYDRFYFSTFATRLTTSGTDKPDMVFEDFMNNSKPLASQAFQPYLSPGKTVASAKAELYTAGVPKDAAYKTAAEYQMIRGPFNINSTSVQAWKAVLGSMNKSAVATLWARDTTLESNNASGAVIAPMSMVNGGSASASVVDSTKIDNVKTNTWNGYRELDDTQLEKLATKIVEQVRLRGPFLSMSEFVNRQVGPTNALSLTGALEAAIAKSEINEKLTVTSADSFLNQVPITAADISDVKLYNYKTPEATIGNPAAGAPGWVSQGDLMRILEPSATVRGDTFVIRTYGEARDSAGKVTAKAYAEAVVQRFPDYVDTSDRPSINTSTDPTAKSANKLFGRRFEIVSFRWLSNNEI